MSDVPDDVQQAIEELDIADRLHEFRRDRLGPDELYDLRREIMGVGELPLAVRVDAEYRNSLRYDDYSPAFGSDDLVRMLMLLGNIEYQHVASGNRLRSDVTRGLAETIAGNLRSWSDEHEIPLDAYLGLRFDGDEDEIERDHTERMKRAKHEQDEEEIEVEVKQGSLDDALDELSGPSTAETQEINPRPPTPPSPDGPDGVSDDNGDDPTPG